MEAKVTQSFHNYNYYDFLKHACLLFFFSDDEDFLEDAGSRPLTRDEIRGYVLRNIDRKIALSEALQRPADKKGRIKTP